MGQSYKGWVVTYNFIPAKVMKIDEIITGPEPGTGYTGDIPEFDETPDVMANRTIAGI